MSRKFVYLAIFLVFSVTLVGALTTELSHEVQEMPLIVQGKFPQWLNGVLVRNSAIPVYKEGKQATHLFDGIAMLHSFTFNKGDVSYTNRFLLSGAYDSVINKNSTDYDGFASSQSSRKKVHVIDSSKWVNNASVNVFKYANDYVALTEAPGPARFDLKTLETLGTFAFQDSLPKSKCFESAHPHLDFTTKETLNYLIEFGRNTHYVLYRMKEGSPIREIVGKIPVEQPAYMHSFAMTEHYLILTEFPLVVNPLDLLKGSGSYIDHFKWKPEQGTRFIVVERSTGKIISQAITDAFFCWHHANAYESKNGDDLIIDLVAYPDVSSMAGILPQASAMTNKHAWQKRLMRYHYSLNKAEITSEVLLEKNMEFPRIDDRLDGNRYRYLYFTQSDASGEPFKMPKLGKFDLETGVLITWSEPGYSVMEPIFVPSPESETEDDGIVLTVIHDQKKEHAFLVALDARNFKEIARAKMPWHIPTSFHGQYFSESTFQAM